MTMLDPKLAMDSCCEMRIMTMMTMKTIARRPEPHGCTDDDGDDDAYVWLEAGATRKIMKNDR